MDKYVVSLMDIQMGDTHLVGVKAAVLGELKRVGFPVPDGVSITTHAFKLALRPYLDQIDSILETHGLEDLSGSRAASKSIHAILTDLVIPAPVLMSLQQKLLEMSDPGTPLAVRSSGTAEDTPDSSFAGLYESKIGVSDNDAIHRAILDVWRSYFNPMALNYRSTTSDKGHESSMGILIHKDSSLNINI